MFKKFKNCTCVQLILGTAFTLVALFLLKGLFTFGIEQIAYANGSMKEIVMTAEDFYLEAFRPLEDGGYVSSDSDPQMILETPMKFARISMEVDYSIFPGEMVLYYTKKQNQGFSDRKRLWFKPAPNNENLYQADMYVNNILSLRIDPTTYAGNQLKFGKIIINEKKNFSNYFQINYYHIYNLLIYTGIISAILKFVQEILTKKFD